MTSEDKLTRTMNRVLCPPPHPFSCEAQYEHVSRPMAMVVERTFDWLNQLRRLRVHYENRADIHDAFRITPPIFERLRCLC